MLRLKNQRFRRWTFALRKHNMKLTATMIAELLTTLSNKQRGKLKQSVDELIETVASFQQ